MAEIQFVSTLGAAEEEQGSERAPRYSREEWQLMKPRIEQMYVTEAQTLKNVMQKLKEEFGVVTS